MQAESNQNIKIVKSNQCLIDEGFKKFIILYTHGNEFISWARFNQEIK